MKLTINAKELLALHNLLHLTLLSQFSDSESSDDRRQLRQLYDRVKSCLIGSLMRTHVHPMEALLDLEDEKIRRLEDKMGAPKKAMFDSDSDPFSPKMHASDVGELVDVLDDIDDAPDYPRRFKAHKKAGPRKG